MMSYIVIISVEKHMLIPPNPKTHSIKFSKNIPVTTKISPKNALFKNSLKAKMMFDVRTEQRNGNVENIRNVMMDTKD